MSDTKPTPEDVARDLSVDLAACERRKDYFEHLSERPLVTCCVGFSLAGQISAIRRALAAEALLRRLGAAVRSAVEDGAMGAEESDKAIIAIADEARKLLEAKP